MYRIDSINIDVDSVNNNLCTEQYITENYYVKHESDVNLLS